MHMDFRLESSRTSTDKLTMKTMAAIKISLIVILSAAATSAEAQILCNGATCPMPLSIAPGSNSPQVSMTDTNGTMGCTVFTATNVFAAQNLWVFVPTGSVAEMETFMWAVSNPLAIAAPNPYATSDPYHQERMCCGISNRVDRTNPLVPLTYAYTPASPSDLHPPDAILEALPRAPSSWLVPNHVICGAAFTSEIENDRAVTIPTLTTAPLIAPGPNPPVTVQPAPTIAPGNMASLVPPPDQTSYSTGGGGDGDGGDSDGDGG